MCVLHSYYIVCVSICLSCLLNVCVSCHGIPLDTHQMFVPPNLRHPRSDYKLLNVIASMNSFSFEFQISYQEVVFILLSDPEINLVLLIKNPWFLVLGSHSATWLAAVLNLDPHQVKRPASSEDAWQKNACHPGSPERENFRRYSFDWMMSKE